MTLRLSESAARRMGLGGKINMLTAVSIFSKCGRRWVHCRCECNKEIDFNYRKWLAGRYFSCGCSEILRGRRSQRWVDAKREPERHGMTSTPEYRAWIAINARCFDVNQKDYMRYGGRGIKVCTRWKDSFLAFLSDIGRRPTAKHSIDRFPNNNGDYEPGNVRWATVKEQANNRRSTVFIERNGERLSISGWASKLQIPKGVIQGRMYRGLPVEQVLSVVDAQTGKPLGERRSAR